MRHKEFCYVDFAKGDVRARNNVVSTADVRAALHSGAASVNSYTTVHRFPEAYRQHAAATGSVQGYTGPSYADFLPFDLDDGNLFTALSRARGVALTLHQSFDMRPDQLRYYFSGAKGFHVMLPTVLMGNVVPSEHLAACWRSMALAVAEMAGLMDDKGKPLIDRTIYDVNRLFRLPDTKHTSGLWKVEMTWAEFSAGSVDDVRGLAKAARYLVWRPGDLEPSDALAEFFAKHMDEAERPEVRPRASSGGGLRFGGKGLAADLATALAPGFVQGQRHSLILCFAGYAAKRHLPRETCLGVADLLLDGAEAVADPDNLPNAIHATYDRVREGVQVKGYLDLQTLLPDEPLAELRRLLGDTTPPARTDTAASSPAEPAPPAPRRHDAFDLDRPRVSLAHVYNTERAGREYVGYIRSLPGRRINIGIPTIDKATRGLMPGTVTTILAKSRVGKSMLIQQIRRHISRTAPKVCSVFFSLEMPVHLVYERDAQHALEMGGYDVERFAATATEEDLEAMIRRVSAETPRAYTVAEPGLGLSEMLEYCELIQDTYDVRVGAILIDYLGLIPAKARDLYTATSLVARQLKPFAKRTDAAVIILSQTRRNSGNNGQVNEVGQNKPSGSSAPELEDARDSGAIEEGSDFIIGVWRPNLDDQYDDNEVGMVLLKNRMGKAGGKVYCEVDWKRLRVTEKMPDQMPHYSPGR